MAEVVSSRLSNTLMDGYGQREMILSFGQLGIAVGQGGLALRIEEVPIVVTTKPVFAW